MIHLKSFLYSVGILLALALQPTRAQPSGAPVTAERSGENVILDNGIVRATIQSNPIGLRSLRYRGREMVSQGGRHKFVYFSLNGNLQSFEPLHNGVFSVSTRSPEMVDISCKRPYQPGSKLFPCDVDVHFVLRRGVSGLYVYVTLDHAANYPELNISVWRMVWSMPEENGQWLMDRIYVDAARHWEIPSPADFSRSAATGIKEIVELTSGPWRGRYDCKYMYSVSYWDVDCWGYAGDRSRVGAWIIPASREFFNDGPTHADLNASSGIIEILYNQIHYNGSAIDIPQGLAWQKIYGPYLLYCNTSADGADGCWRDAQRRGHIEQGEWPYAWLTNALYPGRSHRGTVTGRWTVRDALKPAVNSSNAWIGLAQPNAGGNWQFDNQRYQYWVHADAAGDFSVPNVRPGTYQLYAFTAGAVGEFSRGNVAVTAGGTTQLGDLVWAVPHPGTRIAWEIGVPDRTAREFRHGTDYFQPYRWEKFSGEMSNPLDYTVGTSDWSKDWNYVQCGYLKDGIWTPWRWRIHFTLTNAPSAGDATLTIAYASSYYGRTEVYVNDDGRLLTTVHPAVDGGNALIREGIHAKYDVERVPIPMSLLRDGANTLTLVQGANRYDRPFYHVMYDYLDLELPSN